MVTRIFKLFRSCLIVISTKGDKPVLQTIEELEQEMLNGQKLQGPPTAEEVNFMLKMKNMEDR